MLGAPASTFCSANPAEWRCTAFSRAPWQRFSNLLLRVKRSSARRRQPSPLRTRRTGGGSGAARLLAALDGRDFAFLCCGRKKYTFACLCVRIIFARRSATLNDSLHRTVDHDPLSPILELGDLCLQAPQSSLQLPYNGLPALIFLDLLIQNGP